MAIETVQITEGAGTPIAVDEVAGTNYQVMKVALGADGAMDTLVDSGQQTSSASIPVVGPSDLDGVATDEPVDVEEDATARTKISLLKGIKNYLRSLASDIAAALAAGSDLPVTLDSEAVVLGAGTAAIGTVQVSDAAHNLVPNSTEADQALTVDATAGGVQLSALHADTTHVFITVHDADIRVTFDSSAPVGGSNGHLLLENSSAIWPAALAAAAKFIRNASTSAVVHVSQLKAV